jgi:hypothetical protein
MGGETNWQEMRERFMKMSPEERQKFRDRMRQRFMAQGGPGFGSEGESPRGTNGSQSYMFRMKRKTEDPAKPEVRQRLVVVKENDKFVTRMIKVGATNFEFSEVVDGLKDGEEIEVTTISRALIASEQFNQRIRSQTGLGGMSGSSSSRQVMGGRGGR